MTFPSARFAQLRRVRIFADPLCSKESRTVASVAEKFAQIDCDLNSADAEPSNRCDVVNIVILRPEPFTTVSGRELLLSFPSRSTLICASRVSAKTAAEFVPNFSAGCIRFEEVEQFLDDATLVVSLGGFFFPADSTKDFFLPHPGDLSGLLTMREQELIKLLGEGLSYKQIAARTALAVSTVNNHLANARRKFNAKNTVELLKNAYSHKT